MTRSNLHTTAIIPCPFGAGIAAVWPFGRLCGTARVMHDRSRVKEVPARVVVVVALAFAFAPSRVFAVPTDPTATRGPRGVVEVDMADDASEAALRDEVTAWYGAQKLAIADLVGAGVEVRASVEVHDFDREQGLGYAGVLTVRLEDGRGGEQFEVRAGCPCSGEEFFASFTAAVRSRVQEWVRVREARRAAAAVAAPTTPAPVLPPARYRMALLGKLGVGMIAVGAALVVGGAVMWRRGVVQDEPADFPKLRDGGIAFVASGVLVSGAGVGVLVADAVIDRRWRRSLRPAAVVGRAGGVVGVRGRF